MKKFDYKIIVAYLKELVKKIQAMIKKIQKENPEVKDPVKPVEPKPPVDVPPVVIANPFEKYRGWLVQDVLGPFGLGRGFIGDEEKQARSAGVDFGVPVVVPSGPVVNKSGFVFTMDQQVLNNPVIAGHPYEFTFTTMKNVQKFGVFGQPGAFFNVAHGSIDNGPVETKSAFGVGTEFDYNLPPGTYKFRVTVNGSGDLGVQFNEW
jgi:hypothetical protein